MAVVRHANYMVGSYTKIKDKLKFTIEFHYGNTLYVCSIPLQCGFKKFIDLQLALFKQNFVFHNVGLGH